jgi:Lrp/AsnC family transcriptional regulator for asnA, asnC and gidA
MESSTCYSRTTRRWDLQRDKIDQSILSALSEDSSISIPKLSEKINVNSSVVYSRIKRLVKKKLIERFTIEINNKELGYGVKSLTGINMDSKQRDNVIQELLKIPGVREVAEVTGRFDILVTMYAENLNDMYKIVSENIGKIQGIIGSESFIEMKTRTKQMPYMLE